MLNILAGNWPEIAPNTPFLPDVPVAKCLKTKYRLQFAFHGMEEVVGSIPTRSTNIFNNLQSFSFFSFSASGRKFTLLLLGFLCLGFLPSSLLTASMVARHSPEFPVCKLGVRGSP
jgi:hypothetical protein